MSDPWIAAFLGQSSDGHAGGDLGFGGININETNQVQANPTIVGHAGGDVSVANLQANGTEQDVSGAGLNSGHGDAGGDHGFGGININVTNQIQANPTIIGHADGDVHVTNVQSNETGQDTSGTGFNFGGSEHIGGDFGFGGINVNVTNQVQADPTIIGSAHGDVNVFNAQGNATDQSAHGTGANLHDFGFGHDLGLGVA